MKKYILILTWIGFVLIVSACEREVSTSPDVNEKINNSVIKLTSHPAGAAIYLNGKISGKYTPDSLVWLQDTTHRVTLKRALIKDTTFIVDLGKDEQKAVDIDYYANPTMYGSIECLSEPPNAEIFLNGQSTGLYTPDTLTGLFPGKYEVTYKLQEHMAEKREYEVSSSNTSGATVALEDTTVWVTFTQQNSGLQENLLTSLAVDHDNNVWVGTATQGLAKFDGRNWTIYNMSNSNLPSDELTALVCDDFGKIWMGTSAGVARYDQGAWTILTPQNSGLPDERITCMSIDVRSGQWFGTQAGIGVLRDTGWAQYTTANSNISGDYINAIHTNVLGEIWMGTSRFGLNRYFGEWKPITQFYWVPAYGIPGKTISDFAAEEETGVVWVGWLPESFDGGGLGGLTSYSGSRWSNKYDGLPSRYIACIFISANNVKWIGTDSGLVRFTNFASKTTFRAEYTGLKSNDIKDIVEDQNGNIWIATKGGGLTKYKGEANG